MRKVKNLLLILLSVLLVATGGLLPMAAAQLQDKAATDAVQYADIEALQLKLEEEVLSMTFLEKLFLLVNGNGVEVSSAMTRNSEDQAMEMLHAALIPYSDMGLLNEAMDTGKWECIPAMVFDEKDPSKTNFYWRIHMYLDVSAYDNIVYITAVLDDETGALLALEVNTPNLDLSNSDLYAWANSIGGVYIKQLGIEPDHIEELGMEAFEKNAYQKETAPKSDRIILRHQCMDALCGEVTVDVCVYENGFYIAPI